MTSSKESPEPSSAKRVRTGLTALVAIALVVAGLFVLRNRDDSDDTDSRAALAHVEGVDGLHFTDVSKAAGFRQVQSPQELISGESMSSGVTVADVDNDGRDDVFVTRAGLPNILYMNQGDGTFADQTAKAGLKVESPTYGSSAAAFFDADGNGTLDLFVTGFGRGESRFYVNMGDGTFRDQTLSRGLGLPALPQGAESSQMHGVTVGDANGDGSLDLLVLHWYLDGLTADVSAAMEAATNSGEPGGSGSLDPMKQGSCELREMSEKTPQPSNRGSRSRLFINDGHGNFSDQTAQMGLDFEKVIAFTGAFQDYDGDGWQDLAVTGDGCTSRLFHNENGRGFKDVTRQAGVGTDENGMGLVFKDLDGDARPDLLVSSIAYGDPKDTCIIGGSLVGCSGNRLYLNNGDGTFKDATTTSGLRDGGWGWGVAAEDFANSGGLQVVMTNGYSSMPLDALDKASDSDPPTRFMRRHARDVTRFWVKDKDNRFTDIARSVGIDDNGISHGLVAFDYDNDGDLDILIGQAGERPVLYRNDLPAGSSWLTIRLKDRSKPRNAWADGARVEVFDDADSKPRVGWITTAGSYESQKPAEFHLGFGKRRQPVDRIEIYWPGEATPQVITKVRLDQKLTVDRDE